jgi:nitrate reductase (cytochrome)
VSLPHLSRYRAALRRAGGFLVVSDAYPTATTDVADVVLPAAMWFERDWMYVNGERRIQHFDQLVRPPGDCMSDGRQLVEVERRFATGASVAWDPARLTEQAWDELSGVEQDPSRALPSLASLRSAPGVRWPAPGGVETRWRYNSAYDPAADAAHGQFDFYGHDDHRAWIWLRPYEPPVEAPDRQYPYRFSTGRVVEHWGTGTLTQRVPTLHRAVPHAYVELHREDARALGIGDRDIVRVTSRRGSVELEARIDYRSQPPRGCVFAPAFDEGAPVNLLTLDASCPTSGQPDYGACAVRLERARGSS